MKNFTCIYDELCYADETAQEVFTEAQIVEAFGKSLKEIRWYCHLSGEALGKEIGIGQSTLSAYEMGTRYPSLLQAIKIAAYFSLTVEEFILCGLECHSKDIIELYRERHPKKKKK